MPKCSSCNRVFKDRQALGNHIKTHLNNSDDDLSLSIQPIQRISQNTVKPTKQVQNVNKRIKEDCSKRDLNTIFYSDDSDSQGSDEESMASELSYTTEVDANEYDEYNALFNEIRHDPEDIYQEFPSEEYAEFMNIVIRFHVQDSLANAFIRFFNKYSNRNNRPLPSTSQSGRQFFENLQLPNFDWRKKKIFEYNGKEYEFEYRSVLDGIHQILMNKHITEEFIFKYKSSIDNINMYDSDWWRNVEEELPIGAYAMPIILSP
ncbi:unnamed protein product [Rhizophagus irregularis]|nr:unnamed protein product [Rhizophagus irregularis]